MFRHASEDTHKAWGDRDWCENPVSAAVPWTGFNQVPHETWKIDEKSRQNESKKDRKDAISTAMVPLPFFAEEY